MLRSLSEGASLCVAWRRERLPHTLWVPVAVTLSTASMLAEGSATGWGIWGLRVLVAWLALGGLRLLDDLCEVHHDRIHHPDRVLTQAAAHLPAWVALCWALLLCTALLVPAGGTLSGLAILLLCSGVFYSLDLLDHPLGPWIRLLKYPALALILAGGLIPSAALVLLYAGVCLDELLQGAQQVRGSTQCAATTLQVAALVWCGHWWGAHHWGNVAMLGVACALSLLLSFVLTQDLEKLTLTPLRGSFLLCVCLLLALPQLLPLT